MMEALCSSDTHSYANMNGLQNTSDDIIMNLVMGTMFLVLPALWMTALGWAGAKVGALSTMAKDASKPAQDGGSKGVEVAQKAVSKGK